MARRDMRSRAKTNSEMQDRTTTDVIGKAAGRDQHHAELAEAEGHHPNISFGWGYATVGLQTKKIKGLHENDFIMATKIDQIFDRSTKCPSR